MLHLIKYNLLVKLRNFNMTFWPLVFPLILGTFFFFAFGNLNDADFETVQVAMVQETSPNPLFSFYIDQVKKSNSDLLNIQEMDESAALTALKNKEISGIYYNEMTPSLTVNAHGIPESILQSVLESYNNNLHTIQNILKKHPSGILEGLSQMAIPAILYRNFPWVEKRSMVFAVFLRSDRHGMPVWMIYRLWRRDHVTGQFNSSGGKTLCYSHP